MYYRAVDRYGNSVDFFLSEHRDKSAAFSFFRKAITENNIPKKREFGIYLTDLQQFNINYLVNICTYLTSFYI
ncbi:DDE-type integrase/transposase/recombinase [Cardinium endosymbiont of Oedothorax gibbosus]|uniref:DDE-type integrase/transposase/recombinase n=1 Tax=Cardinium endosymbiont of Oedothorax gibbosus TaxID=931101 RepID=UPI003F6D85D3